MFLWILKEIYSSTNLLLFEVEDSGRSEHKSIVCVGKLHPILKCKSI